jgi:acylphosphatase
MVSDYAKVHGFVTGRVQGVYFRYFTQDTATKYGLTGWVRNLPDGRVEFAAEGPEGILKDFVKAVNQGPISAKVTNLELEWSKFEGEFKDFKIKF